MRLTVVSHKLCWPSASGTGGFSTDGGFPLQMAALSELFEETRILVPCEHEIATSGVTELKGNNLSVIPMSVPAGVRLRRKINMVGWAVRNAAVIWREVRRADAVHAPIPGDIGTFGFVFALLMRKPLFVRHCGNWFVQQSTAERLWVWLMERYAGGRNVMLATGGAAEPPSSRNSKIGWIFSTSLRSAQMQGIEPRESPKDGILRIIIVCRQEEKKGTGIVIASLPLLQEKFPQVTLDVVGGGSLLEMLKEQAAALGLEGHVTFHGKVEQAKVLGLLKRSHIFCYPTSASEGFPKVVLEALACGLPVVTTRVSVLPQLISTGCGVLLDEVTPAGMANAITHVCSSDIEYNRMSLRAIETAREYTLEKWRDNIGQALKTAWNVTHLSHADFVDSTSSGV
jgi:glycosyltransferase involved in cell wall biosynthesis